MNDQARVQEEGHRDYQGTRQGRDARRAAGRMTEMGLDTIGLWADTNQRVLREMAELSVRAYAESTRVYAEMQQTLIQGWHEAQSLALRCQTMWPEALTDPLRWYQRSMVEAVESAQKTFRLMDDNAQVMTQSAERLQASAEQAGRGIQEAFNNLASKVKAAA